MKNTILVVALFLVSAFASNSFASNNTLQGNSLSEFGNYTLTPSENYVVIDNVAHKTWDLTYSGNNEKYQVIYSPGEGDHCCFIVRNENFEIQYAKQLNGFGVKLVEPGKRTLKKKEVMDKIDYEKFVNQLLLTSKDKSVEEYLGLVACFMPLLFG